MTINEVSVGDVLTLESGEQVTVKDVNWFRVLVRQGGMLSPSFSLPVERVTLKIQGIA